MSRASSCRTQGLLSDVAAHTNRSIHPLVTSPTEQRSVKLRRHPFIATRCRTKHCWANFAQMRLQFRLLVLFVVTLLVAILFASSRGLSDGSVNSQLYWLAVLCAGALIGGVASMVISLLSPRRTCPDCGTRLPKLLNPFERTRRQWIQGGWVCYKCGCKVNSQGRKCK